MSKLSRLFLVSAPLAFGVACGSYVYTPAVAQEKENAKQKGSPAPIAAAAVKKWEYRIVTMHSNSDSKETEKELNQLSEQGYEIVSAPSSQSSPGARTGAGQLISTIHYTLKRAMQ